MVELYPPIEPFQQGRLDVGDGQTIAWEVCGAPDGKPAVVLHGGPGSGCSPHMRRAFDPRRYRIVLFDQRGCGRSTPHASDPAADMTANTTAHLVADMEALREHLGIERWLVYGGSWGATLALAYAEQHPGRVSAMVLQSVTTSRRAESQWLYGGVARFFPEAWARFRAHVPEAGSDQEVVAAYARRMEDVSAEAGLAAARAWCDWEAAVLSLEVGAADSPFVALPPAEAVAFVRICARYVQHGAWLDEGALIRDAGRLAGIPGVIIHGRRDMSCPIATADELARAWPGARLVALDDTGHLRSDSSRRALLAALDGFATGSPSAP
jgi:proline iminopeptidase